MRNPMHDGFRTTAGMSGPPMSREMRACSCWSGHLRASALAAIGLCLVLAGCDQFWIQDADREVYRLIEKRQQQALGATSDVRIDGPSAQGSDPRSLRCDTEPYAFVPHPIDNCVPPSFTQVPAATRPADPPAATQPGEESPGLRRQEADATPGRRGAARTSTRPNGATTANGRNNGIAPPPETVPRPGEPAPPPVVVPGGFATMPARPEMNLQQVLAYAFRHSREFQTAKETLYLAALELTLERHMWTPRFFGDVSTLYAVGQGEVTDKKGRVTLEPDNTLDSVARAGVRQRLPYGGEVVAQVINHLVRDVSNHITNGETGQGLIEANLPLLRGAGPAAYETRYKAERNVIYAIRTFEGYRRNLVVEIAAAYFDLQRLRQEIINANQSVDAFAKLAEQTRALSARGRKSLLEFQRADQEVLVATNDRIDAITRYQTALDAFKLQIGMPIENPIDVPLATEPGARAAETPPTAENSLEAALRMPTVGQEEAIAVALKYRLDLLNDLDRIGDAERGVSIAENSLLPDLKATSSVQFNSNPDWSGVFHYSSEYNVYTAGLALELPLDRKAERNALRRSVVDKNAAQRAYEQGRHEVTLQVRSAMRRVEQQQMSLQIQIKNRDLALERREYAQTRLRTWGDISNREVVDAENFLLDARNRLATAQAALSLAILQFRRDTGTLRVDDEGKWTDAPVSGEAERATKPPDGKTDPAQNVGGHG